MRDASSGPAAGFSFTPDVALSLLHPLPTCHPDTERSEVEGSRFLPARFKYFPVQQPFTSVILTLSGAKWKDLGSCPRVSNTFLSNNPLPLSSCYLCHPER